MLFRSLDGQTTKYAVCPTCHCTYLPRLDRRTGLDFYPEICTNLPAPGAAQCNTHLKDGNNPKKTFLYHNFKDYLAALFSRGDLEELMDNACDRFRNSYSGKSFDDWERVTDIFQGDFFSHLKSPASSSDQIPPLFLHRPNTESRLIFTLHLDF